MSRCFTASPRRSLLRLLSLFMLCTATAADEVPPRHIPHDSKMSYLDNGEVKVGVDLSRGGAIVFLAPAGRGNLVNNFDLGRQIQLSFFSGPVPFEAEGQRPPNHWKHLGWNPIQAGDDFDNRSRVITHENDGRTLYVKTQPIQWPLDNVSGECTFESWLELDGAVLKARARLNNTRTDRKQYAARLQELPAVYANSAFHQVVSYTGDRPFTNGTVSAVPAPVGKHPWSFWLGTENWSAMLDADGRGLGLITPGRVHFTGGFAGQPGPNDTFGNSTAYLAGQGLEILDHNIAYEFRYEIVVGGIQEIRARAASLRTRELPTWTFSAGRQGWHYQNASDSGWPINGYLHVRLDQDDPQLISPYTFLRADEASSLVIEAAFKTKSSRATVFWQQHGQSGFTGTDAVSFPIKADETFRDYKVKLASEADHPPAITRIRFDPIPAGSNGDWIKVRSIRFTDESQTAD